MIKKAAKYILKEADEFVSRTYPRIFGERSSLMIFIFHSLFRKRDEANSGTINIHPQEAVTTSQFRWFAEYYLEHGYTFVSPDDILGGLEKDKKYVFITFDDGYYNNHLALPILRELKVPAVFFVSTGYVKSGKSFWWDVVFREMSKRGASRKEIAGKIAELKQKTTGKIEKYIISTFGEKSMKPISDIDRPFKPDELRDLSKEKYVFIGNHTENHATLTNYSLEGVRQEIKQCQEDIHNITGTTPNIIAYPNGNFSDEIINVIKEVGLKLGVTAIHRKNYLPINFQNNSPFMLDRFVLQGDRLDEQCELYRSDVQLEFTVRRLLGR